MELVTNSSSGAAGQVAPSVSARGQNAPKLLAATATFLLSEEGRKASLLSGGDGRAVQSVTLDVPANRLHLVSVDRQGVARLRLRPRFEVDGDQRVARVDSAPAFDAPPAADELLRLAARNHELEQTYHSARTAAASTRHDAQRELRERVAQAFMADPSQRAVAHPPPTQRRCCIQAQGRRHRLRRRRRPSPGEGRGSGGDPPIPRGPASQARAEPAGTGQAACPARREEAVRCGVDRGQRHA